MRACGRTVRSVEIPLHLETVRDSLEMRCQRVPVGCGGFRGEGNAHEELTAHEVVELGAVCDVAAMLHEKARDGMNDAQCVRARQPQDEMFVRFHDSPPVPMQQRLPSGSSCCGGAPQPESAEPLILKAIKGS